MEKNYKDKRLEVRLTQAEKKQIEKKAKKEGKSISVFVVECCTLEKKCSVDADKMREILRATIQMQDTANQLKEEQRKLNTEIEQLEKEMNELWHFLR